MIKRYNLTAIRVCKGVAVQLDMKPAWRNLQAPKTYIISMVLKPLQCNGKADPARYTYEGHRNGPFVGPERLPTQQLLTGSLNTWILTCEQTKSLKVICPSKRTRIVARETWLMNGWQAPFLRAGSHTQASLFTILMFQTSLLCDADKIESIARPEKRKQIVLCSQFADDWPHCIGLSMNLDKTHRLWLYVCCATWTPINTLCSKGNCYSCVAFHSD